MKKQTFIVVSILVLCFCITFISAMKITFFYSEGCSHCQNIKPFVMEQVHTDNNHWNIYDIAYLENKKLFKEYGFKGIPAFVIKTNDGREIKFTDANIRRLNCELKEMTTKECPTYYDKCVNGSWFINQDKKIGEINGVV